MADVKRFQVAVFAPDGFEEVELTESVRALKDSGASAIIVSPQAGSIQAFKHHDKNFAAEWTDEEVAVDRNWVTSRQPRDIPALNREMQKPFSGKAVSAHQERA